MQNNPAKDYFLLNVWNTKLPIHPATTQLYFKVIDSCKLCVCIQLTTAYICHIYHIYIYIRLAFTHAFLHNEKSKIWQKGAWLSWVSLLFEICLVPIECQGTEQECNVDAVLAMPNSEQRGVWRVKGSRQIRSESWFERLMVISHGW